MRLRGANIETISIYDYYFINILLFVSILYVFALTNSLSAFKHRVQYDTACVY